MRLAVLINARIGSKRLPGKHLKLINGKPALSYLIERLQGFPLIIATGGKDNRELETLGISVEYGDPSNIPMRHLQIAARLRLDGIISVDGDDLLTSPIAVKSALEAITDGFPLVRTEGLPMGLNVLWGYSTKFLAQTLNNLNHMNKLDTGWGWIFPKNPLHIIRYDMPYADKVRASLDTPEDLAFFTKVLTECPKATMLDDAKLTQWIRDMT